MFPTEVPIDSTPWEDIPGLVAAFENCTLPKGCWTHLAHLTVAHHYLWHHSRDEATRLIRSGIQRYNLSQGNPSGYHETITLAWIALVAGEIEQVRLAGRAEKSEVASARELAAAYADQDFLFEFYTRPRLMSDEARAQWVPPDRRPLE
jgi:hypothetical protein